MIADIITEVFNVADAVIGGLGTLFTSLIDLVYTAGSLTTFGTLVILVAAVPFAWSVLNYVLGLFKQSTKIKSGK